MKKDNVFFYLLVFLILILVPNSVLASERCFSDSGESVSIEGNTLNIVADNNHTTVGYNMEIGSCDKEVGENEYLSVNQKYDNITLSNDALRTFYFVIPYNGSMTFVFENSQIKDNGDIDFVVFEKVSDISTNEIFSDRIKYPFTSYSKKISNIHGGMYYIHLTASESSEVDFTIKYEENDPLDVYLPLDSFVERMYTIALGRDSDVNGKKDWLNRLKTNIATGADIAEGFIFSDEFKKKNLSDNDFVTTLYKAFMDRNPDAAGLRSWVNYLQTGVSRRGVMDGFLRSQEFDKICNSYGITAGQLQGLKASETNYNVTSFVYRMYDVVIDRKPDRAGLDNWVNNMVAGKITVKQMSSEFVFSQEMKNKNLSNKDYVLVLYRSFLGRGLDPTGEADWVGGLNSEKYTREHIFNGVVYSPEFTKIATDYGLVVG